MLLKGLIQRLPEPSFILIEGARGSGKDVTAHQVCRILRKDSRTVHINLHPRKYNLPNYFRRWDRKFHNGTILYLTDAHLEYFSTEWQTDKAKTIVKLINISRHKDIDMVWTTPMAYDIPLATVRKLDATIYKEPIFRAEKFERYELREEVETARKFFQGQTKKWKWEHAVAYTQYGYYEVEGIKKPHYWSEELSKAHAGMQFEVEPTVVRVVSKSD